MNKLIMLNMDITEKCNLCCCHCGAEPDFDLAQSKTPNYGHHEIAFDEAARLLTEASRLGCRDVTLAGGEPFLHPELFRIIDKIAELGMHCAILTNGTLLNSDLVARLSKCNGIGYIRISLDYADAAKFEKHRGYKNITKKVVDVIKKIKAAGIPVGVGMTVLPENLDEIGAVIELAYKNGSDFIRTVPLSPRGRGNHYAIDESFWAKTLKQLVKALCELDIPVTGEYAALPNQITEISKLFGYNCPAGVLSCSVSANGYVKTCPIMPVSQTKQYSWRDRSLSEIWDDIINN